MKVRYTLPARGALRVSGPQPIALHDWHFSFQVNEDTQFVDEISVEIHNVPKENWPTLQPVEQDPDAKIPRFPFDVNADALKFNDIHDKIVALESMLSVFGLWAIDYSTMEEEWISEEGDEKVGIFSGWKMEPQGDLSNHPVSNGVLARCIVAAGDNSSEYVSVAHFRLGREHFENRRYLEAIRHLFFFLEYEYGEGQYSKKGLIKRFGTSDELLQAIADEINSESNVAFVKIGDKIKWNDSKSSEEVVLEYIVELRGQVQHANGHTYKKWHPSRDEEYKFDAVFLMNLVGRICHDRIFKAMADVPLGGE